MRTRLGTIDRYFADGLGLDAATIDAFRVAFADGA